MSCDFLETECLNVRSGSRWRVLHEDRPFHPSFASSSPGKRVLELAKATPSFVIASKRELYYFLIMFCYSGVFMRASCTRSIYRLKPRHDAR